MAMAKDIFGFLNRLTWRPQRKGGGGGGSHGGNTTAAICDKRQRESFCSLSGLNSGQCSNTGSRHGTRPNPSQSPTPVHQLGVVAGVGASGSTTPTAPPLQPAGTGSARLSPPIKSPRDYNEYRVIRLDNGLTALLISGAELSAETPTYMPTVPTAPMVPSVDVPRTPRISSRLDAAAGATYTGKEEEGKEEEGKEEEGEEEDEDDDDGGASGTKPTIQFDGTEPQQASNHSGVMIIESVAACGLCVGVGSFSDPPEFQGLAHLLEHMVFMGSERFPRENEFDAFLNKHGGETNASTDSEATTFYFDCQYQYLFRALERFAQFFISPLIKRGALSRELEALDSEFQSVLQSDSCRRQQLFSQCARAQHPATQFLWGNIQSLRADPDDRLYRLVHEFRRRHYSAHRMTLAVKAPIRLDLLEARVVQFFSQVPSNGFPPLDFSRLPPPFDTPHFRRLYCIMPVKDTCQVDLTWALPPCLHLYRSKPHDLAAWVLGHEGRGSLISYLRRKLWALDVCTGNWDGGYEMNSLYSLFSIHLTLTDEGAHHVPQVVEAVFGYIHMLRTGGPQERLFREVQTIENIDFLFGEEESAADWVEMLSINMQIYPPQEYITGPKLYFEYDPEAMRDFVNQLVPSTVNVMFMSKTPLDGVPLDRIEPWFRTPYNVRDIPASWLESWEQASPNGRFALPEPNRFLTTDFSSLPPVGKQTTRFPVCVMQDSLLEVWYRRDDTFQLPVAFLYFQMVSPLPTSSLHNAVLLDLLVTVLKQQLVEELYPAEMALLSYCVYSNEKGLVVRVEGFSQKLPLLLDAIFNQLARRVSDLEPALFAAMQESLRRLYHNTFVNPSKLANELRMSLLLQVYWTPVDKYGIIARTTLEELTMFARRFLERLYIQCLVQGNVTQDDAVAICKRAADTLRCEPLLPMEFPVLGVCQVPIGEKCCRVKTFNPEDKNCSTVNYYQCGRASVTKCCMSELLVQLLDEPAFNALRTREQLGYDVTCQRRTTYNTLGFLITVNSQADKYTMDHVDGRIEAFLKDFSYALKTQCAKRFKFVKRSLRDEKECVDFDLQDEVSRNWKEITSNTYMFDRAERERQCLKTIRLKDLRKWFQAHLGAEGRRKLSVQVVGSKEARDGTAGPGPPLSTASFFDPGGSSPAPGTPTPGASSPSDAQRGSSRSRNQVRASTPSTVHQRSSFRNVPVKPQTFSLRYVRNSDVRPQTYFISDIVGYKRNTMVIPSPGYVAAAADNYQRGAGFEPTDEDGAVMALTPSWATATARSPAALNTPAVSMSSVAAATSSRRNTDHQALSP